MIKISAKLEAEKAFRSLDAAPATLDKYLLPALDRAQLETVREAQRAASQYDSFGTNKLAIHGETPSKYVREVSTGTNYAAYLEQGIKPGTFPNVTNLSSWVKKKFGLSDIREIDRATYLVGRSIKAKGIAAKPYMAPTEEKMRDRSAELIASAVTSALGDINAGRFA